MIRLFAQMIVVVGLPVAAFVLGLWLMSKVVDREYLLNCLSTASAADSKPLGQRLTYDAEAVRRHWATLDPRGREVARQLLEIDLAYPCLYGGALIFSLAIGWWILGRPLNFFWVAAPVLVAMFADWCENLVQLNQLGRFESIGLDGIITDYPTTLLKLLGRHRLITGPHPDNTSSASSRGLSSY